MHMYVRMHLYLRRRQSAIVARNYIHMHRDRRKKNNAIKIKVTYTKVKENMFALQMSLEHISPGILFT